MVDLNLVPRHCKLHCGQLSRNLGLSTTIDPPPNHFSTSVNNLGKHNFLTPFSRIMGYWLGLGLRLSVRIRVRVSIINIFFGSNVGVSIVAHPSIYDSIFKNSPLI